MQSAPTKHRILIIDDNKMMRNIYQHHLSKTNYHVAYATDGEQGLELFAEHHFHLVISDYDMPGINGEQVLSLIRERTDAKKNVPFIFVSSNDQLRERNLNCNRIINKTTSISRLLQAISEVLSAVSPVEALHNTKTNLIVMSPPNQEKENAHEKMSTATVPQLNPNISSAQE